MYAFHERRGCIAFKSNLIYSNILFSETNRNSKEITFNTDFHHFVLFCCLFQKKKSIQWQNNQNWPIQFGSKCWRIISDYLLSYFQFISLNSSWFFCFVGSLWRNEIFFSVLIVWTIILFMTLFWSISSCCSSLQSWCFFSTIPRQDSENERMYQNRNKKINWENKDFSIQIA